jgi:hypothetical protein
LPVTVIQGTSDAAKALRRHIEKDRAAQPVSDLFHGQHEVSKGSDLDLARQVQEADAAVAAAAAHLEAQRQAERGLKIVRHRALAGVCRFDGAVLRLHRGAVAKARAFFAASEAIAFSPGELLTRRSR